ncbi:Os12g0180250 [Oryza sativa Japonica Group]|uniref:Os12g0180250 protein n=1 Tax=Oryza sativa subsp. japonica TaxID=39947 RepID=A0A0P0Y7S9_ORYSJ|nr:hypothetical protein EE612_058164 [Oryza sativa]BAT16140.1 Os12g0180250 [Oryza sativa Japonica Group]
MPLLALTLSEGQCEVARWKTLTILQTMLHLTLLQQRKLTELPCASPNLGKTTCHRLHQGTSLRLLETLSESAPAEAPIVPEQCEWQEI